MQADRLVSGAGVCNCRGDEAHRQVKDMLLWDAGNRYRANFVIFVVKDKRW